MRNVLFSVLVVGLVPMIGCRPKAVSVPFVGCPADGQTGPIQAPEQEAVTASRSDLKLAQIAFYKGEQTLGAFAPAGWHCAVWYGSGGARLLITPAPMESIQFPPSSIPGPAIEYTTNSGGTSGRFEVARVAAKFFPQELADFIQSVKDESEMLEVAFDTPPYPDSIEHPDGLLVEFSTAPGTAGFGTAAMLTPSSLPIHGIAAITDVHEPNLLVLRVRLGPETSHLASTIIQLNKECMKVPFGCDDPLRRKNILAER